MSERRSTVRSLLALRYVGMDTQEVKIGGSKKLDVTMTENGNYIDEVVVIGYGTVKKRDLTGYVSSVKSDDLNLAVAPSVTMQKAIDFLKGMLDYEKSLGKTSMRKLILKGGDLQVLQFNTEDMKKVEKMAKKYGILYSVLPDCNRKDGLSEVIFHTEAVPRVNMMIQKLKFGKIATFDDYLKNGDEKSLGKLMDFLKKQQGNEKSQTIEGDRVNSAIDGLIEKVGMFVSTAVIKCN